MRYALDWIDLSTNQVINRVALPTFPQGMAVGADGSVLITAVGDAAGLNAAGAARAFGSGLQFVSQPFAGDSERQIYRRGEREHHNSQSRFRVRSRLRFVNRAHPLQPVRSRRFA